MVVGHLQSFHLGHATADELVSSVENTPNEHPKKNMVRFFSGLPQCHKVLRLKLKRELSALPQVIPPNKASVLAGEWNSLVCERTEKARQGFPGVFARKC